MPTFRRSRRRRRHPQPETPLERIEQGEGGERALQDWLDRSRLAYLFLDQTPLTIPATLRADLKRPDFLVAVEGLGTVAVDAKAKSFIDGCFVLDISERRRLDGFEKRIQHARLVRVLSAQRTAALLPVSQPRPDGPGGDSRHGQAHHRVPVGLGFFFEPASISFVAALAQADAADRGLSARRSLSS